MATPLQPRNGLLDMMGQGDSGFAGWLDPRRNAIINFGTGMIGHGTAKERMAGAAQGLQTGRQQDTAQALLMEERALQQQQVQEQAQQKNQTLEWLKTNFPQYANLPPAQGFQLATAEMGRSGAGSASFSQTPVFFTDDKGNQHIGQMSSGGGVLLNGKVMNSIPEGWKITARPENFSSVDFGGGYGTFDPNAGQFSGPQVPISGAPSTNMDVRLAPGGGREMTPAAGSPQELEQQQAAEQARMKDFLSQTYSDIVIEDIDRVLENITSNPMMNTGPGAALTQGIPGFPAFNTKQLTDTIRANVGFDRLQQMREASPTGGALGAVSEFENRLLQATLGNLELSQDLPQLQRNLERLREVYMQIVHFGVSPDDPLAREIMGGQGGGTSSSASGGYTILGVE